MSAPIFEFETEGQSRRVIESWRLPIPDADSRTEEEIEEHLTNRVAEAEFLGEKAEDVEERELVPGSVERLGPPAEGSDRTSYTVIGVLTDSRDPDGELLRFAHTYITAGDFRVAEDRARQENPTLAIAGVVPGKVDLADVI